MVLCCAVIATLMTSRASAGGRNKNFFHGYGGPPQHFVKHAYTRHYYGLGHAVSNYPPFWLYDMSTPIRTVNHHHAVSNDPPFWLYDIHQYGQYTHHHAVSNDPPFWLYDSEYTNTDSKAHHHAVSNDPPFWLYDNGKKGGGKRRGRGGKKRDRGGVIVVKHGGYGGYGGGYGGGYDDYDYYDDLY
ncbi:hypothetical protein FJT64_010853 [Amphibalanus amphitrite]|uniref:Uncharacterized protein n=1 Tax=Amphibalanus amphitrite TaxID=1232801 RepID=A0A6A4VKU0_AMPAM|nr:hypothetical protein FJT64_010853 [Amphibalanus amphitrite]